MWMLTTFSLRKAVLPCRTMCCDTVFCREHITEVGSQLLLFLKTRAVNGMCSG